MSGSRWLWGRLIGGGSDPSHSPAASKRTVTAISSEGDSYQVTLDIKRQVLRLDVPEDIETDGSRERRATESAPLYPSLVAASPSLGNFLPAAALALKGKQLDDGLYAAVELATEAGVGRLAGKAGLLEALLGALAENGPDGGRLDAAARMAASLSLRGVGFATSAAVREAADILRGEFEACEEASKPLGFYTWSPALGAVFRGDRFLQAKLEEESASALAAALTGDKALGRGYEAWLRLAERLTNPFGCELRDLRVPLYAAAGGAAGPSAVRGKATAFLPASRSHETDLVKKLYGDRSIPEGFNLADEMIERVRDGRLDLAPSTDSGWYDHQTWALEALIDVARFPEGKKLSLTARYERELEGLFKALLALTRETYVKQLEVPMAGAALMPKRVVYLQPDLSIEPVATYYRRRAASYGFVRPVLEEACGAEGLAEIRRLTADGPVEVGLANEVGQLEALFHGAYQTSCEELGMVAEPLATGAGAAADRATFDRWRVSLEADPDLSADFRMMVPVFYDIERRKTKVWAVLGCSEKPIVVDFARCPVVKGVTDEKGRRRWLGRTKVVFESARHRLPYLVTAEAYVSRLLDRDEFRRHCDRHGSAERILAHLS